MRYIFNVILLFCALEIWAEKPNWYNDTQRAIYYPQGQYFIGIAYGEIRSNESVESAMERVKGRARAEAASTISVHVQSEINIHVHDETFESLDTWTAEIKQTLDDHIELKVNWENIPGLQVETWRNPQTGEIAAFAYIKKSTLCRQMDKQLIANLTRIETILENTEQLIANGQKLQALEAIDKATTLFNEVEQAQRILIAVDPLSDAESLQLEETKQLTQRYIALVAKTRNGITVYIEWQNDRLGVIYDIVKKIEKELSKIGCSLIDSPTQADKIITLDIRAEKSVATIFQCVIINISASVYDTKREVAYNAFVKSSKGCASQNNGGYNQAAQIILERGELDPIANDIIEILKNK